MSDEEWSEYRFSEEARVELTHVPDEGYHGPDEWDDAQGDAADALSEMFGEIEEDGRKAYLDGELREDNPYGATLSGESWDHGWQEEERKEADAGEGF